MFTMSVPTLLLVDRDENLHELVDNICNSLCFNVLHATSLAEALQKGAQGVDVVLLEKTLPDGDGIAHIGAFRALPFKPHVLIMTEFANGDIAERALREGAWDFLCKPFQMQDLSAILEQGISHRQGRSTLNNGEALLYREGLIGTSTALLTALSRMHEAAQSGTNVLIYGETGTGKELFARMLHKNSERIHEPFITVDCAALTENLVESHLFGHAKGAFTGADKAKDGLLLKAHGGTLFLDEIGELPLSMQKVFLRALELRRFRPVGMVEEVPSDFRLIAATNKDLSSMVKQGQFRDDLLYRLQGFTIRIPPLRERKEDIPALAEFVMRNFCEKKSLAIKSFTPNFLDALHAYSWPGNVRELINTVERACVVAKKEQELYAVHLPTDMRVAVVRSKVQAEAEHAPPVLQGALFFSTQEGTPTLKEWKKYTEQTYVQRILEQNKGDIRACAQVAGVSRGHFYELLKKHGVS